MGAGVVFRLSRAKYNFINDDDVGCFPFSKDIYSLVGTYTPTCIIKANSIIRYSNIALWCATGDIIGRQKVKLHVSIWYAKQRSYINLSIIAVQTGLKNMKYNKYFSIHCVFNLKGQFIKIFTSHLFHDSNPSKPFIHMF